MTHNHICLLIFFIINNNATEQWHISMLIHHYGHNACTNGCEDIYL